MAFTTIDDPTQFFQCTLYAGDGNASGQAITHGGNSDLQADFIWIKNRTDAQNHSLTDSVRGANKGMLSNSSDAESTDNSNGYLSSFNSDGFTTANAGAYNNASSKNYVAWCWKESVTAGFDIVSYTGNGSSGLTVSHSLSAVPSVMIIKNRSGAYSWAVYHHKNTSAPETETLFLDVTDATADRLNEFNDTAPTSSLFTVGDGNSVNNSSENFIAYLFRDIQGFSKFGSYTGNGNADGTFVYTGFKPAWIMIKGTNIARNWGINDTKRSPINQTQDSLYANVNDAETGSGNYIDFLSNGFKLKDTALTMNGAYTYIYLAFAENPFVTSTGVPTTAR